MTKLDEALDAARAAHGVAADTLRTVVAHHAAALAAETEAREARTKLVETAAGGTEIAPKALLNAEHNLALATSQVQLWAEARVGAEAKLAEAAKPVQAAEAAIQEQKFALACAARLRAVESLQTSAEQFGAAFAAWLAAGDEILAAWPLSRQPEAHHAAALRESRRGAWLTPRAIQTIIIQTGSVNSIDLMAVERSFWAGDAAKAEAA